MLYDGVVHHAPGGATTLARTRLLGTRDKVAQQFAGYEQGSGSGMKPTLGS